MSKRSEITKELSLGLLERELTARIKMNQLLH